MNTRNHQGVEITGGRVAATFAAAGFALNGIHILSDMTYTTALKLFTTISAEYTYNSPQSILASLLVATTTGFVLGSIAGSTVECMNHLFFKPRKMDEQNDLEFNAFYLHGM